MHEIESQFLDAMRSAGIQLDTSSAGGRHPIADGKVHRADSIGYKTRGKKHIWYVLHADKPPSGAYGDYKLGIEGKWTAGREQAEMSREERAQLKKRMEETARERASYTKLLNDNAASVAKNLLGKANSIRARADHPYLAAKNLPAFPGLRRLTHDVKYIIDPEEDEKTARSGSLLVPAYQIINGAVTLVGLQFISGNGKKRFLRGTPMGGTFHPIGPTPQNEDDIYIAEGYATAARIHEATGKRTVAAFNAGNLKAVVRALHKHYTNRRFIVMADNDRFTHQPIENPGVTKATEAAEAIGAWLVVPQFPDGADDKTDFDDLAQLRGIKAVRDAIDAVLPPPALPLSEQPDMGEPISFADIGQTGKDYLETFGRPHFRCLGVDGLHFYYQPLDVAQVVSLSASGHKIENLQVLAPVSWWEAEFPAKTGVNMRAAVDVCFRACKHRRKFVPHNAMRGRGAWFEGDTPVFHAGEQLIVNGQATSIGEHHSRYVYDEGEAIPVKLENPLTTEESRKFLQLCRSLRWQSPLSATLLAGWCVIAPVCGFLKWRPHMWISGEAGSGKSTVMDKIVKVALAETAKSVLGNTTEAGIRGMLGNDALPIIFDEAEPRDMESKSRLKGIMDYARASASESQGMIYKGTANQGVKGYRARSMFIFASINMQIEGYADETRITQLVLTKPDGDLNSEENKTHYARLLDDIINLMTPDFARRMLARTILLLPTLRRYVKVFTEAATIHLGAQRLGDQVGPMLAGSYLTATSKDISVEEALEWIRKNDWTDMSAKDAAKDDIRFLQHVTGHMVRHDTPEGGRWSRTIGELIEIADSAPDYVKTPDFLGKEKNKTKEAAIQSLARLGIRVARDGTGERAVEITTTYEGFRRQVLARTEWSGAKYRDILKAIPGAYSGKGNRYFTSGVNTPFVIVPISAILQEREPGEDG